MWNGRSCRIVRYRKNKITKNLISLKILNVVNRKMGRARPGAMLAHKWLDYQSRLLDGKTDYFCSPKYDGIRCVATSEGLFSRSNKKFQSCTHVLEDVQGMLKAVRGSQKYAIDGELYMNGGNACFERIVSAVKTTHVHATNEDYALQKKIQFHVFDVIDLNSPCLMPFTKRLELLKEITQHSTGVSRLVPYVKFKTQDKLDEKLKRYVSDGCEGLVVRTPTGLYAPGKRSADLLKYVPVMDAEFDCFAACEGIGKFKGTLGSLTCLTAKGKKFQVNPGVDDSVRKLWWKRRSELIGKKVTVKFQRYTEQGIPRFASAKSIRNFMKMRV